ncbi:MAG TPA: T9SS type A sorting domain-containing protein [bacterium]|nr:T9SS type A sorting domain-containing protein [bacterium]
MTDSGIIYIVYFDSRNSDSDSLAEVWVSRSADSGKTFVDFRVGETSFHPCLIDQAGNYWSDYIGIAASADYVYPVWMDNREEPEGWSRGHYQAYTAPIPLKETFGTLSGDSQWKVSVLASGDITIPAQSKLTIYPNTRVIAKGMQDRLAAGVDQGRVEIVVYGELEILGGEDSRPVFLSDSAQSGSWYGIRVMNGGRVLSSAGAVISDAWIGLTIDTLLTSDTLQGFAISNCDIAGIITRSDSVRFLNDTISDVPGGYGLMLDHSDPCVEGAQISDCQYGIYAVASNASIRGSRIVGPGMYGIYSVQDVEFPGDYDTLRVTNVTDSGYFTSASMYAAYKAHCVVDSCRFITDTLLGVRTPYGIKVGQSVNLKLRRSLLRDFGTACFYSYKSKANLGKRKENNGGSADPGGSSIHTVPYWIYDEEIGWFSVEPKRASHTGNTSTDTIRAEHNWWGSTNPPANWFTVLVDRTPFDTINPGLGKLGTGATAEESRALPRDFALGQNYPNPFNGATVIEYEIHEPGKVRLSVYNVLGQLVRILVDGAVEMGRHQIEWNGRNFDNNEVASGVYFYRLQSEKAVESRKMVLLR